MAIPKPKPELDDKKWIEAVFKQVCVHVAADTTGNAGRLSRYRLPHGAGIWRVCSECREELDRRFRDPRERYTYAKDGEVGPLKKQPRPG